MKYLKNHIEIGKKIKVHSGHIFWYFGLFGTILKTFWCIRDSPERAKIFKKLSRIGQNIRKGVPNRLLFVPKRPELLSRKGYVPKTPHPILYNVCTVYHTLFVFMNIFNKKGTFHLGWRWIHTQVNVAMQTVLILICINYLGHIGVKIMCTMR